MFGAKYQEILELVKCSISLYFLKDIYEKMFY